MINIILVHYVQLHRDIGIVFGKKSNLIFVASINVPNLMSFPLASLRTKRTLKLRFFTAFVRQMSLKRVLSNVKTATFIATEAAFHPFWIDFAFVGEMTLQSVLPFISFPAFYALESFLFHWLYAWQVKLGFDVLAVGPQKRDRHSLCNFNSHGNIWNINALENQFLVTLNSKLYSPGTFYNLHIYIIYVPNK